MAKNVNGVSMRVRIGECELEVSGPKAFVEKKIEEFIANQRNYAPNPEKSVKPSAALAKTAAPATSKKMGIAQFFKKAAPKTDVDRTLLAGYFLEKYKNQENFTSAEIREAIKTAKRQPPRNPSETIAKNIRKGFMMSAGDRGGRLAFLLTSDGEDKIEEVVNQN